MQIEIDSPLSDAELTRRLTAYGHDWRESKIPPALLSRGLRTCKINLADSTLLLVTGPQGRGPKIEWKGNVLPLESGSRLVLSPSPSVGTRLSYAAVLVFVLGLAFASSSAASRVVLFFVGVPGMVAFIALSIRLRTNAQTDEIRVLLADIIGAPSAETPHAT